MSEVDALLFANEAFYRAFADRDYPAMAAVWAETEPVVCVHPGWDVLAGRDGVLRSWAAILGNPDSPDIRCHEAVAHVLGEVAMVVCYEEIDGQYLIATNVFLREGRIWKMIHHQSGPTSGRPAASARAEGPDKPN